MTSEEADEVMARFKQGATFSYDSYALGSRLTFFYDRARGSFAVREQEAHSGNDSVEHVSDEAMSLRLQRGFRRDEIG